jgi:hypothetical protein
VVGEAYAVDDACTPDEADSVDPADVVDTVDTVDMADPQSVSPRAWRVHNGEVAGAYSVPHLY